MILAVARIIDGISEFDEFYNNENWQSGNRAGPKGRKTVDCMHSCIILQRDVKRSIERRRPHFQVKCVNVNIKELVLDQTRLCVSGSERRS